VQYEVALGASTRPSDFELQMQMFRNVPKTAAPPAPKPAQPKPEEPRNLDGLNLGGGYDFLGGSGQK
jgi:hypothetical protein